MTESSAKRARGRGRPFQKGQSGNPGGRPKTPAEVKEALDRLAPRAVERLGQLLESADEDIAYKAAREVLDRRLGRPTQPIKDVTEWSDEQLVGELRRMAREVLTEEEGGEHATH